MEHSGENYDDFEPYLLTGDAYIVAYAVTGELNNIEIDLYVTGSCITQCSIQHAYKLMQIN